MQDFQNIVGNLMGTNVRDGRAGRVGQDDIHENPAFFPFGPIPLGGHDGPPVAGRFTFTTGTNGANRDSDNDFFGYVSPSMYHLSLAWIASMAKLTHLIDCSEH